MKILKHLPEKIAVFPLPGALLLPRAQLPLHIFEPRYLAMLDDVLKMPHRLFGMAQPFGPEGKERLHRIGCAGRVTSFTETDDGRYMITLTGVSRFRILEETQGFHPYRQCVVSWDDFDSDRVAADKDVGFEPATFLPLLRRYFDQEKLQTDCDSLQSAEPELLINTLSMLCPFEVEDKQALLEAPTLTDRRETLTTLMEFALRGGVAEDVLQ